MKYLEGEEITIDEIKAGIRKPRPSPTRSSPYCAAPVLPQQGRAEAARRDRGVHALPGGHSARSTGTDAEYRTRITRAQSSDEEPFSALAFKIMADPVRGQARLLPRLLRRAAPAAPTSTTPPRASASASAASCACTPTTARRSSEVYAGDIAAVVGLKDTTTGDTLCDESKPIILESMDVPGAGYPRGHRAQDQGRSGQDDHGPAAAWRRRIPTFKTYTDQETGQTIIAGMGELHLEIIVDRMLREFKVEATVGKPQVAYKRDASARPSRRGGPLSSARAAATASTVTAWIEFDPAEPGDRLRVRQQDRRRRRSPRSSSRRIDQGIQEAAKNGILGGYEVVDFKATLLRRLLPRGRLL